MTDNIHHFVPARLSYSFKYSRRSGWWTIYGHDGPGMRNAHTINPMEGNHFASKAEARAYAKQHAENRGASYEEWSEPPPPTPDEAARWRINHMKHRVLYYDAEGERLHDADKFRESAEAWMRAASICGEVANLELAERAHFVA